MSELRSNELDADILGVPLELPCGVVLKNRLVKAAMSDSLGDGAGNPTDEQIELYRRWSAGGAALSLIGEVQVDHRYPEKPGNLVLGPRADDALLARLARAGSADGAHVWPQLGHAGALAHLPISRPAGPSALSIEGLQCDALTQSDVEELPLVYARAAAHAQAVGFSGVEIHAGHGFLLSQFLSPLFNRRSDRYGGSIEARCRLLLAIVHAVRSQVGAQFAIAVKINSSDQLEGGLSEDDAIVAIGLLGKEAVDLIDISGGTYFPGATGSSDRRTSGPYFLDFARRARTVTDVPLMLTGGFKTRREAADAIASGATDAVGLARTMALDPDVPATWCGPGGGDPEFPRFDSPPVGGITAWFTMRLTALANGTEESFDPTLTTAIDAYESRDAARIGTWEQAFENSERPAVPALKNTEFEKPIASAWRPVFTEIVRAFVSGDYAIECGIPSVNEVDPETARFIEEYIAGYGDVTLVDLTDETWDTSVAKWNQTYWDVLIDLRTAEEGRSDLVLAARVTEAEGGFEFEIEMVYVP